MCHIPCNFSPHVNVVGSTNLAAKEADSNDIWGTEEVLDGAQYDDVYDTRLAPEWVAIFSDKGAFKGYLIFVFWFIKEGF